MKVERYYEMEVIYELLNLHKNLTAQQLAKMTNVRPADIRNAIKTSRRAIDYQMANGVIVANNKGYYITRNVDAIMEQAISLIKRGNDIIKTGSAMLQLASKMGQ